MYEDALGEFIEDVVGRSMWFRYVCCNHMQGTPIKESKRRILHPRLIDEMVGSTLVQDSDWLSRCLTGMEAPESPPGVETPDCAASPERHSCRQMKEVHAELIKVRRLLHFSKRIPSPSQ